MIQKYKSQLFLILTIGLSLWIHFTLWWGLQHFHESEKHLNTSTPIEIITREKKSKSVVTQTELQQLQEALKDLTKRRIIFRKKYNVCKSKLKPEERERLKTSSLNSPHSANVKKKNPPSKVNLTKKKSKWIHKPHPPLYKETWVLLRCVSTYLL